MVNVDEAFEMRYKKAGEQFQVLVDFDKLKEFQKKSEEVSVYDVLADNKIFKDQKKGELASTNILEKVFPEKSEEQILKEILTKGECQIPTAYLNKLREQKKVQIINYITENAINGQTKGKYAVSLVEGEINKLKFNVDPNKDFEPQAQDVLKMLKKVMPISLEEVVIEIGIPPMFVGSFYGPFRKLGKTIKEFYDNDSNLILHIKTTEGTMDKICDYVKNNTNGEGTYFIKK